MERLGRTVGRGVAERRRLRRESKRQLNKEIQQLILQCSLRMKEGWESKGGKTGKGEIKSVHHRSLKE